MKGDPCLQGSFRVVSGQFPGSFRLITGIEPAILYTGNTKEIEIRPEKRADLSFRQGQFSV